MLNVCVCQLHIIILTLVCNTFIALWPLDFLLMDLQYISLLSIYIFHSHPFLYCIIIIIIIINSSTSASAGAAAGPVAPSSTGVGPLGSSEAGSSQNTM